MFYFYLFDMAIYSDKTEEKDHVSSKEESEDARMVATTIGSGISVRPKEVSIQPIIGTTGNFQRILDIVGRVAGTDVTVLIRGESGTGKDLIARQIHEKSPRRIKRLIKVLCPAIPETLLESELFGHEKGSFSGAHVRRPGKFEFAHEGTIFLDEIGEIPLSLQSKLLQVLQEGRFSRIGGSDDVRVDVRIIAATNRNLEKAMEEGAFREDLFYRLNVVNIYLPPLRDRKDDIPSLVQYFLDQFNRKFNKRVELSEQSMKLFPEYHWPGNVRELENTLKGVVVLGNEKQVDDQLQSKIERYRTLGKGLTPAGNPPSAADDQRPSPARERRRGERRRRLATDSLRTVKGIDSTSLKAISRNAAKKAEERVLLRVLDQTHWNRKEAARVLGISYKALLYKIKPLEQGELRQR